MRYFILFIITALIGLPLIFYLGVYTYWPTKDEKVLSVKLQKIFEAPDITVKIQDIHSGDWQFACINPADPFSGMEPEILKVQNVTVINGAYPSSSEIEWGLYFVYPENKIEYYSLPAKIRIDAGRGFSAEGKNCEKRENAYFKIETDNFGHKLSLVKQ